MSEFEDKLQSILGNPDAMDQIMSIARSISGNPPAQEVSEPSEELCPQTVQSTPETKDPFALLNNLDPRLLQIGLRLLSEYNSDDNRKKKEHTTDLACGLWSTALMLRHYDPLI